MRFVLKCYTSLFASSRNFVCLCCCFYDFDEACILRAKKSPPKLCVKSNSLSKTSFKLLIDFK